MFLGGLTFLLISFEFAKNGERTRCASKLMKHRLRYVIWCSAEILEQIRELFILSYEGLIPGF